MFHVLVIRGECTGLPFIESIKLGTYVCIIFPSFNDKRIRNNIFIFCCNGCFIQQYKQIPVRTLMGIATGTGTIEPDLPVGRNNPASGFLNHLYYLLFFCCHNAKTESSRCKSTKKRRIKQDFKEKLQEKPFCLCAEGLPRVAIVIRGRQTAKMPINSDATLF